jgi:hypothetical protein
VVYHRFAGESQWKSRVTPVLSPGQATPPYFVTRPVAQWLERELDFPNRTANDVALMPEAHITESAPSEGVSMNPQYAAEHREAGSGALGIAAPGIGCRQLLDVFPFGGLVAPQAHLGL